MKIVEYRIVMGRNQAKLEEQINEKILLGWQPYGSMTSDEAYFFQPVVKYAESEE